MKYDISIIGSGPNALYAYSIIKERFPVFNLGCFEKGQIMDNLKSLPDVRWHSRMRELFLGSNFDSNIDPDYIPTTSELVNYYNLFIKEKEISVNEEHELIDLKFIEKDDCYELFFKNTYSVKSKYVLLSTGIYLNKRKLKIKSKKINYDFGFYKSKKLLLIGSGNSAIDFIIYNLKFNKITWLIRGNKMNDFDQTTIKSFNEVVKSHSHNLLKIYNSEISKIVDNNVFFNDKVDSFDIITALIGFNSENPLFSKVGLKFNGECLSLDENFQTNLKNVFAIGSISSRWNLNTNKSEPTFIHNGNPNILNIVLKKINELTLKNIFPENIIDLDNSKKKKSLIRKLWK